MLRRHREVRKQLQKLLDAALFGAAFWLAHFLRSSVFQFEVFGGVKIIEPFDDFAWLLIFIIPFAPFLLEISGFYDRPLLASRRQTAWCLLKGSAMVTMGAIVLQFLFREQLARSVYFFFPVIAFVLVMLKEEIVLRLDKSPFGSVTRKRKLIVAGEPRDTAKLDQYLSGSNRDEFSVMERIPITRDTIDDLPKLLHDHSANAVVLCAQHTEFGLVEKAINICELEGVEVWLMADFFKTAISQTSLDDFYGRPMLVFRSVPEATWQVVAKQVIDSVGALVLLFVFSPFMIAAAIAIKVTSPGPILFRQQRAGLNGQPFTMLKFRSMVSNAEQLKQELEQLNEMSGPVFKVTKDPRVTKVGALIRKYSIDEFPQLINVLRGDMSLVGPRPLPVDEVDRFDDRAHRRRLSVKPGLTCLWQVAGRSEVTDFKDWVRLDLEYIDNWTIWLDVKILIRTVPVVLMGTGAK